MSAGVRNTIRRYGTATLLTIAALLVRLLLQPVLGVRAPYITLFMATAASAGLGGFGPGMLSAVLGLLLAGVTLQPGGNYLILDPNDPFGWIRYLLGAGFVSYVCHLLIRSRERARTTEQRLRENQRIYRAIGESIPYGIWICDAEGKNIYASDSFLNLVGLTQEQCSAFGWTKLMHPDDVENTIAAWKECVAKAAVWDRELRILGKDGAYHPVLARGVPIRDDQGKVASWAGINLDISRLKETEAELYNQAVELRRSNRELEQYAFVASHDLQEPLRTVNIYTELMLRKLGEHRTPDIDECAGYVRRGAQKMERLIHDLLDFSRVLHAEAETQPIDPALGLDEALNVCRSAIETSGAEIVREPLPIVLVGQRHITQLYQNLISNAIKYRNPEIAPRIRIRTVEQGASTVFVVEDNGIGFDPVYAKTIFGLFKRLNGERYPGNGLGLSICQRIVERYGGEIWAESEEGKGAKFFFTLPLAEASKAARVADTASA